jgi:hypothetical protein
MKPYFRVKGKYQDGRKRLVIEWLENGSKKSKALPKPEKLLEILDTLYCPKTITKIEEKNGHP